MSQQSEESKTENSVHLWGRFEASFESETDYDNPLQDAELRVTFIAPSGKAHEVDGFWDGGNRWRVRFMPDELGTWRFTTACSDEANAGLHGQSGGFTCTPAAGATLFGVHGPLRVSADRFRFEHADGTPFFWLADTAWNGPLRSTADEWALYLRERVRQGFSAVQWVCTQWRAAPDGDIEGQVAYTGNERIAVNPAFFQRLDDRADAIAAAGLLNVPVLLWTNKGGAHPEKSPGVSLPEDQAVLLVRYMVARWGSLPVVWILPGDGRYEDEEAARWRRIGRAAFGEREHAPVALHLCGMHLPADEFRDETWLDVLGYQSGHGDSDETWEWIVTGPPSQEWQRDDRVFALNMEPAYENHVAYQSKRPHDAANVRRALYWSLLNAPTAGVSYGGHGVWGWDDGTEPSVDHPNSGVPLPWAQALTMPAAEQLRHLADIFTELDWWRLRPDPSLVADQPGRGDVHKYVLAARSAEADLAVVYAPGGGTVALHTASLPAAVAAIWHDPRTGEAQSASGTKEADDITRFTAPDAQDWVLVLRARED